ncbi:RNA polymerase sigma factor [Nisaea sp.]|uniref:RNA polymerase sigma factor n=1 Tax=Nisaea sp. TaxID=2024842 RepID=UPI0032653311
MPLNEPGTKTLNNLAEQARTGDKSALEALIRASQDSLYTLALRFLANPDDARDATQEILTILVTRLSTFEGRSAFRTWAYRIAVNYLLRSRKIQSRTLTLSFKAFEEDLHAGLVENPAPAADDVAMLGELRIACTMAMLLCLDVEHRIAFVLGEILELGHREAADVLEIAPATYRKRLSRARTEVIAFSGRVCGLANPTAQCTCPRRLPEALRLGRLNRSRPLTNGAEDGDYADVLARTRDMERDLATLCLQKSPARFSSPGDLAATVRSIVTEQKLH